MPTFSVSAAEPLLEEIVVTARKRGEAEVDGIELAVTAVPTEAWEISAGLSYLFKNELTKDQVTDEVVAPGKKGDTLPRVPDLTYNFSVQYNFNYAVDGWNGWLRSDYSYRDESETELSPDSPNNREQDSYSIWNLRIGASSDSYGLDVTLFWDNVLDEDGDVYLGVGNGEPTNKVTNRPSTVGLTVNKRF